MSKTYKVGGLTCGGCAASVQKAIAAAVPGAAVAVDLSAGTVTVEAAAPDDAVISRVVEDAGFDYAGPV